jgi:membrane protein, MarC family
MLVDQTLLLTQFMTLLAVLDPISHTTLFLSVTDQLDKAGRRRVALIAIPLAFAVLVIFAVVGQFILEAMNISLISFQIAGGIIMFLFALLMVLGQTTKGSPDVHAETPESLAVYPVAVPIIAGPGAMLAMVILTDNNRLSFVEQVETVALLGVILLMMLGFFLAGDMVSRVMGRHGASVLRRVMGILLAALSINLIAEAMAQWLRLPPI